MQRARKARPLLPRAADDGSMIDEFILSDTLPARRAIAAIEEMSAAPLPRSEPVGGAARPDLRRREPRFAATHERLWIQWWDAGECNGRTAQLVNVSRNGAMIVASVLFRPEQILRVFLEEAAPEVGVNAVVLGVVEGVRGLHQIRLEFPSSCPDHFLQAAADVFESWLARSAPRR
jgi:hypothetical protein